MASAGFVLGTAALLLLHLVWPTGAVGDGTYLVAVCGAAVIAWAGALRRPRRSALIPTLIAIGVTLSAVGDVIWQIYRWNGIEPNVSPADIPYFAAYLGLGAALLVVTLVPTRKGARIDTDSILDALTIIVVSVLLFWDLSIAEIVGDTTVSASTRVVWAAYPVLDAILLALVARAMFSRQARSVVGTSLAGGIVCWLASDLGYLLFTGTQIMWTFLDLGWMLGALLMAVSAWRRPSSTPEVLAADESAPSHPLWKLGIATVPLLLPLILQFVNELRGRESHSLAVLVSMSLLLLLAFVRSARLLQSEGRARKEARAARDAAVEASRAKSAFLATMSHEIRTPMNGVIGLTGLLQNTELDERQRQYVDGVHVAGESLLRIINDILDFSKVEAGKLELDIIDFNLVQVVEEAAEMVAESAQGKGLELLAYCSPELPLSLRGDPSRLRQVLLNLASNAVKFTDSGEVVIRASLDDQTPDAHVVRFEVTDTGVGLEEADRERLFEPFSQADSSTTRRFGGTGLGLAICRQLVHAMGGELGVDSALGRGSIFWFTLPLALAEVTPEAAPTRCAEELAGQRVLIVDDNHTNLLILSEQLAAWGVTPDVAVDGASALRMLEVASLKGEPYRMALLDLCMPGMDGLELARRISQHPALTGIALVLLTSVPDVTAEQAAAAGIAVRLTKPVHLSRLHRALLELSRTAVARETTASVPSAPEQAGGRGHVLVVEDNHVNQLVAVGILEYLGYTTEVAGNGADALVALARTPFAAVLMDCQMPVMDGYAATQELRRIEGETRRTPVIAMTAGVTEGERERCIAAGMDDYVSKPVDPKELGRTLVRCLPTSLA